MKLQIIGVCTLCMFIVSCSSTTYDDIAPEVIVDPGPLAVTYQDVAPTFNSVCLACHSNPPQNGAPMSLTSFENVRDAVLNRDLIDRISRDEGASGLMPLGGQRLPQENINQIVQWEADGLLEN
jgi:hypothetical protein